MAERRFKISYVKKPFARRSFISLPLAAAAFVFGAVSLYLSVRMQGSGGLNVGAWGFSSFVFSLAALIYGGLSFLEKEKNYVLARIGMILGGLLALFWICLTCVGLWG